METLRRVHRLTCQLLLVWFALSVGAAVASPLLQSHSGDVVCSGTGAVMLMPSDDGTTGHPAGHQHECHLCVMVGVPPVPVVFAAQQASAETPVIDLPVSVARQSPAPFQQRGPPLL
jgi:hypothetical protein